VIRSQIPNGVRVFWRKQGKELAWAGKGILIERSPKHYKIYVEEVSQNGHVVQKNLGITRFGDLEILIENQEEIWLEELLTSDYSSIRELAKQLLKKSLEDTAG
jgi:hypothetical protein